MYKKILVAYDGSAGSEKAIQAAMQLAHELDAELWVLSVEEELPQYISSGPKPDEERVWSNHYFEQLGERAAEYATMVGVVINQEILKGHSARTIVEYAEEGKFELLVIGNSGHSEAWGDFLGATADKVTRYASCSVLVVR